MLLLLERLFSLETDFAFEPAKQKKALHSLLAQHSKAHILVVEVNGEVVGMCTVQVLISTAEGGDVGLIEDVIIAPPHRNQGLGKSLLAAMCDWCSRHGLSRLQLLADRDNSAALAFYKKTGWQQTKLICLRKSGNTASRI